MKKKIRCSICGKEIENPDRWPKGNLDQINGAVIGEYLAIEGHKTCLENVDKIVIDTNRKCVLSFLELLKEKLVKERLINDELANLLKHARMINSIDPDAIPKA